MLSPNPTSIRSHISPVELQILALVLATFERGYRLETSFETPPHQYLVDDGYLTRTIETGMSRSYFRYRLTEAGENAFALRRPTNG